RVLTAQVVVFISLVSGDVAGSFLVQVGDGEAAIQFDAIGQLGGVQPGYFLLVITTFRAETFFADAVNQKFVLEAAIVKADAGIATQGATGASFDGQIAAAIRLRQYHVDHAVQGVGTIECSARATDHFDALGVFGVGIKQLVDVTEACCPQRDALFSHQEGAAGSAAAQYGGTDRGQAFLAVVAVDVHARQTVGCFLDMGVGRQLQVFFAKNGNTAIDPGQKFGAA